MLARLRYYRQKLRPWQFNFAQIPRRILRGKVVHAYWYAAVPNFGDDITPALLAHYGYTPIYAPPERSQLAATGSILHKVPVDYRGCVLGAGFISAESAHPCPHATMLAVRGVQTRELAHAPATTPLGDPGLLLPQLLRTRPARQYQIGLVPHFVDKAHPALAQICARYPTQVKHIDVQRDPVVVMEEIAQCEFILSSSLHGMVVADALGIPNAWLVLSDRVLGSGFKFYDYFSAFDASFEPASLTGAETLEQLAALTHPVSPHIAALQTELDRQFRDLAHRLR